MGVPNGKRNVYFVGVFSGEDDNTSVVCAQEGARKVQLTTILNKSLRLTAIRFQFFYKIKVKLGTIERFNAFSNFLIVVEKEKNVDFFYSFEAFLQM